MSNDDQPAKVGSSEGLGAAVERAKLRELAELYLAWEAAGCQIDDPHDAYPNDLWPAYAGPRQVLALLDEIDRLQPMDMALCERHSLVLRVGQPYVFAPVGDCESCAAALAQSVEAYGTNAGAPNTKADAPPVGGLGGAQS